MDKWELLIAARERLHLSQAEAAERLDVGLATYQRWELGKQKPQPRHMRTLGEIFDPRLVCDEQEAWPGEQLVHAHAGAVTGAYSSEFCGVFPSSLLVRVADRELHILLASHLTAHLWSLTLGTHTTCEEKRVALRRVIEEFDCMNTQDKDYQITRREAIGTMATLPLITFGLALPGKEEITATRHTELLAQCTASMEACWELHQHGDASELLLGFQCTSRYLAVLQRISRVSTQHRKEALRLATQYAILKTFFGWHCAGATATVQYAQEAVALSRETGVLSLQLSAYHKLAWAYLFARMYPQALATAQEAQTLLERFDRQPRGEPIPTGIRGGTASALAMTQARNGLPFEQALARSMERDPGTEVHAYLPFTRSSMLLEAGWVYCCQDDHTKTIEVLGQRLDLETFAPRMPGVSEVGRVETINLLALSSLKAKDRDLERTIHFWQTAVGEAKALHSDMLFTLASTTYEHMTVIWPGEARVRDLRDHLVRWE